MPITRSRDSRNQKQEEVWHCIRLENTGKTPWTTAPAETVKDGLIIGQDTLNYTPARRQGNAAYYAGRQREGRAGRN